MVPVEQADGYAKKLQDKRHKEQSVKNHYRILD
jgi:hypothetical protein